MRNEEKTKFVPRPDRETDGTVTFRTAAATTLVVTGEDEVSGEGNGAASEPVLAVFANRFEVLRELGEGGMGRVYLARDRQIDGRRIALKVLLPHFSENATFRGLFFREIQAATQFVSEHVVQVRDTGQMEDGRLFLTMDFVPGKSLRELLDHEGSLGPRHALEIARQILLGLASGHAKGYLHRDVKPSNVMLAERIAKSEDNPHGVAARVLDFGIAALAAEVGEGEVSGTPAYMSPEQLKGEALDPRSDLFSVGVVLYEMLSGRRPFSGKTMEELMTSVLDQSVRRLVDELEHVPKSVRRLLRRALRRGRDKRFQSAEEFVRAIERSRAYKLAGPAPLWSAAVGAVAVAAAMGEAGYIWTLQQKLAAVRIESRLDDRDKVDLIDKTKKDRDEYWKTREEQLKADLGREKQELTKRRKELEEDLDRAKRQIRNLKLQLQPEVRSAATFDQIVDFLRSGSFESARTKLHRDVTEHPDSFLVPTKDAGGKLVDELVQAFYELGKLQRGESDYASIGVAEAHYRRARDLSSGFPILAEEWITQPRIADLTVDVFDRVDTVEELFDELEKRLEAERSRMDDLHEVDAGRFLGRTDYEPREALDHAAFYECDHLAQLLTEYATNLREGAVRDGRLVLERLREEALLEKWANVLEDGVSSAGAPVEMAESILALWSALCWYDLGEEVERALAGHAEQPAGESEEWRDVLRLQHGFWQTVSEQEGPVGQMRFLRFLDLARDEELWFKDAAAKSWKDGGKSGIVERTTYSSAKRTVVGVRQAIDVSWNDHRLRRNGKTDFDLRSIEDVDLVFWSGPSVEALPEDHFFRDAAEFARFVASLRERPVLCLRYRSAGTTYLVSPELGIVEEEVEGETRLDLVFARRRSN